VPCKLPCKYPRQPVEKHLPCKLPCNLLRQQCARSPRKNTHPATYPASEPFAIKQRSLYHARHDRLRNCASSAASPAAPRSPPTRQPCNRLSRQLPLAFSPPPRQGGGHRPPKAPHQPAGILLDAAPAAEDAASPPGIPSHDRQWLCKASASASAASSHQ